MHRICFKEGVVLKQRNYFSPDGYLNVADKIDMKTLVYGEKTLMVEFRLQAGAELPAHHHPYEQTGYLVSGKMDLTIEGKTEAMSAGDSWVIYENETHSAICTGDAVAVEVFSPVREDYIPE